VKKFITTITLLIILLCAACPVFADTVADPQITIVNPTQDSTIYSENLLISVKIAKQATVSVEVLQKVSKTENTIAADGTEKRTTVTTYEPIMEKETFVSTSNLSFYTKKIENIANGTYKVVVNTLGADGQIKYTTESVVKVEDEPAEESKTVFENNQTGTFTFLQNLLKTIFGN